MMIVALVCAFRFGVVQRLQGLQLPARKVFSVNRPPTMEQCAECHLEICEKFAAAPHRRTLTQARSPLVHERFSGKEYTFSGSGPTVRFESRGDELWLNSAAAPNPIRVDWVFGSGQHAQTPVSMVTNPDGQSEILQHRVSWYPAGRLGITPGLEISADIKEGFQQVLQHEDHLVTMDCFECHVTHLPHTGGLIDETNIIAGVGCDRCHPGGNAHIASIEGGQLSIERWSELTPLESVNRCGECHRRSDQLTDAELDPTRPVLARFASVGLAMSGCFKHQTEVKLADRSQARLDCLTCHDPHNAASRDPQFYIRKCVTCHGPDEGKAAECASQPMSSNCIVCHMPTQPVSDDLAFTDHWIRLPD